MGRRRQFLNGMSVLALLILLGGCRQEQVEPDPVPLNFDADPRILRGVWVGEETGVGLVLDLKASNPHEDGYTITGTFQLGDEAAVPFSANVSVPVVTDAASPEPQLSQPCGAFLADINGARGQQWEACGFAPYGSPPRFSLSVIDWQQPGDPVGHDFVMTRRADETPLPIDDDAPITTDRERYTPEDFGDYVRYTIETTYTNTTRESVYLVPCSVTPPPPAYQLERFDEGQWQFNYLPTCRTGPGSIPATEVKPNEGFTAALTLDAYTSRTPENYGYPLLGTDIMVGANRFVFHIVASVDEKGVANDDLLPLDQRVSNAFELKAP